MELKTPDILDANEDAARDGRVRVVAPIFKRYGLRKAFAGAIATLKIFEDNSLVREALGQDGHGKVLVVDGGGSMRCALVGDQLALLAQRNGWEGIVVFGCIRDSGDINAIDIGVRALDTHPLKSVKKGVGETGVAVSFGGVTFRPGEWLCADEDGMIVAPAPLI